MIDPRTIQFLTLDIRDGDILLARKVDKLRERPFDLRALCYPDGVNRPPASFQRLNDWVPAVKCVSRRSCHRMCTMGFEPQEIILVECDENEQTSGARITLCARW